MNESAPQSTFHGLPLTDEQNRQVLAYIRHQQHAGKAWETPELDAMLDDMLNPPEITDEDGGEIDLSIETERATANHEEPG